MKGFFLLLSTISFLVMIQIQSGILQSTAKPVTTPGITMKTTMKTTISTVNTNITMNTTMNTTTFENISTATSKTTCKPDGTLSMDTTVGVRVTTKKAKGTAPALSSLGSGSVLIFLTNTLIYIFHLS